MDYRHITISVLTEFAEEHPEMTMGEVLYSIFREGNLGKEIESISDFRKLDDREIYTATEKAKLYESE